MSQISVIDGIDCLQPTLSSEPPKRTNAKETINEVLIADLGDRWNTSPYLIV